MPRSTRLAAGLAALALAAGGTFAGAPGASGAVFPRHTLAKQLVSPLSVAFAPDGAAYVAESFAGRLVRLAPGGGLSTVYRAADGDEVGAVSYRRGRVTFGVTKASGRAVVKRINRHGRVRTIARLKGFEARLNPDGDVTYGFRRIDADCASQFPAESPATYTGIVETHPYGTAVRGRRTYVADAAGNAILRVRHRRVRTIAVLPAVGVTVSAQAAQANGFPDCAVGLKYWFEPVPTDVEVGPGRMLFVSALTGGPEDGSLGPQGRVYRIDPRTGDVTRVATGIAGAVGVAVSRSTGDVYVSQLFGGRISVVRHGTHDVTTLRTAIQPAAVELWQGHVYATTRVLADPPEGRLVMFNAL